MAQKAWLGNKIRHLRRDRGLAQVEMARRLGISPSYLNLIEHNQRPLTLPLLLKLAQAFDIDLRTFSDNEEARVMAELTELLGEPVFRDHGLGREDLKQLVATSPSACHAILALFRAYQRAREDVRALAERLSDDTYLATSMHEFRQLLATIRSFSEILHDYNDLDEGQRRQIHEILVRDSERVTAYLNQMAVLAPDEGLKAPDGGLATHVLDDFIHDQRNHFPTLEDAAERLWRNENLSLERLPIDLARLLEERHAVTVEVTDEGSRHRAQHASGAPVELDAAARRLRLAPALPRSTRTFRMARALAALSLGEEIAETLSELRSEDPEVLSVGAGFLTRYFAGALTLPYEPFLEAARAARYDLDLLCRQFAASFEQVCHRLTTLQRPGAEAIPFHFLRVDVAGNISKRYSASGLPIPRYGGACPRWNIHGAFMTPGRILTQLAALPDGATYFMIARTVSKPAGGYHEPQSHFAVALGCEIGHAREIVYSDGLDLETPAARVPVGMTCRLCERKHCPQRAFPPVLQSLASESRRLSAASGGPT